MWRKHKDRFFLETFYYFERCETLDLRCENTHLWFTNYLESQKLLFLTKLPILCISLLTIRVCFENILLLWEVCKIQKLKIQQQFPFSVKNSVMSEEQRWKNSVKCLLILVSMPVMTWGRWASHVTKNIFTKNNNFAYFSDVWKTPIFRGTKRTGWQSMKSNLR